ncbi:hypothetical protein HZS61_017704 [Fusarium oxysporum f. sp. conglutinans]|uniref:propanoyl-CoA C-acyltransferase n=1 Tax=Fusarium oxysporum f. sp. conglutinans TaxID=100902 RepID=A0A8H6GLB8_FUSOX|nr:hypothetical protein HZS61_017704 [Fusarium oxysporum f. sp. conglutinans]
MPEKKKSPVYVLGVGMTKFIKPRGKVDYTELGFEAGIKALLDAQINYDDVDQGVACYCYGDSTCGQRVFYQFGMTQIPIYNVNNNCSTGSTGLNMARTLVEHGAADCVMVVGFEKMAAGSLQSNFKDRENPIGTTGKMMAETRGVTNAPGAAQMFGNAGREYMEKYGATAEDFAEIARINHAHSPKNPYSQFQQVYTKEQVLQSPMIHEPLTKLQCCPTSDGGAAAIIVSEAFLNARPHLREQAVEIAGQHLATDAPSLFSESSIDLMGYEMTQRAMKEATQQAGISPRDCQVVELHDCFSANEMITIDALGLCDKGKAHELVRAGDITYGGKYVINPSGGLISKGHPLGATGIAQCAELVWHLRGWANNRATPNTRYCLQHNLGLGGAAVVTVYKRADGGVAQAVNSTMVGNRNKLGYNPAVEAKGFTQEQVDLVRIYDVCRDARPVVHRWMAKNNIQWYDRLETGEHILVRPFDVQRDILYVPQNDWDIFEGFVNSDERDPEEHQSMCNKIINLGVAAHTMTQLQCAEGIVRLMLRAPNLNKIYIIFSDLPRVRTVTLHLPSYREWWGNVPVQQRCELASQPKPNETVHVHRLDRHEHLDHVEKNYLRNWQKEMNEVWRTVVDEFPDIAHSATGELKAPRVDVSIMEVLTWDIVR